MMKKILTYSVILFVLHWNLAGQGSGFALQFDGINDFIVADDVCDELSGEAITFSAWVFPEGNQTGNATILGFNENNTTSTNNVNILYHNNGLNTFVYFDKGANNIPTAGYFPSGRWYHVAVAIDDFYQVTVYVNGVESLSIPAYETPNSNDRFSIGQEWDGAFTSAFFRGKIDEVRVWNYARTPEEIRTDMCKKLIGNESGLVAYFRLDEGSGSECMDAVTQQNLGELVGMDVNNWIFSSAPLGDESVFAYPPSNQWNDLELEMPLDDNANVVVSTVEGNPQGVFLYQVTEAPNTIGGLSAPVDSYYGVFASDASATFDFSVVSENGSPCDPLDINFDFFSRNDNAGSNWTFIPDMYFPGVCASLLTEQSTVGDGYRGEYALTKRLTVSSQEVESESALFIFPNPAYGHSSFMVQSEEVIEDVMIFAQDGRRVRANWTFPGSQRVQIQLDEGVSGLYLIGVKTIHGWSYSRILFK